MPAAFIGHGNPMNALEHNRYTAAWQAFGAAVPRPRAILVVSAHWYINATAVTAMPRPRTIHDFYGFPQELFDVDYPVPGLPELADEISDVVHPTWIGADQDSWGIDHGTWSVLLHAFPDASIPVVQLSINADKSLDHHVVHNLGAMDWGLADDGYEWARRFSDDSRHLMLTQPTEFATLDAHPDYRSAVPTPDHFIPALYFAGLAGAHDAPNLDVLVDGYAYGSLSMTAYTLDLDCTHAEGTGGSPQPPADLPPDGSNI